MKLAIALAAALISIAPVTAFAQGTGTGDRGDQESHVGPGSENRDNGPYGDPRSRAATLIPGFEQTLPICRTTGNN